MFSFLQRVRSGFLTGAAIWILTNATALGENPAEVRVIDKQLKIEVFAESPQIVTPTGIVVDHQGNVLVIESHTHFPKPDYDGPKEDRIKRFRDNDGDGKADQMDLFFQGGNATMNLAAHSNGYIYVATRRDIFRLRDDDGDGRAEIKESLALLETDGTYPHNGLSGFAFDFDGSVFFGMGENLGAEYTLIGSDGSRLRGGGEGGGIYRMQADGSQLERVATGFWNPFHLCFDAFGRLFAVDNDPDSRPPCRLLHIVPDGDYGYRFRNGRKGTHPFTSWFGDVPGTLGLAAETGEAPSGVLAYESDGLPNGYRGSLLAGSWGNHAIQRYRMKQHGATFRSVAETVIKGGKDFRPVGIALAPDGSLLVSDWVDRSYNVHGRGRIWRISQAGSRTSIHDRRAAVIDSPNRPTREQAMRDLASSSEGARQLADKAANIKDASIRGAALAIASTKHPQLAAAMLTDHDPQVQALGLRLAPDALVHRHAADKNALVRAAWIRKSDAHRHLDAVFSALRSQDPFLRQAARLSLRRSVSAPQLAAHLTNTDPAIRREVGLVLRRTTSGPEAVRIARTLLNDDDPLVRFVGIQWAGESRISSLREDLEKGLANPLDEGRWTDAYLAALHLLEPNAKPADFEKQQLKLLITLLGRKPLDDLIHARALRRIPAENNWWTAARFFERIAHSNLQVRLETIRTLRESPLKQRGKILNSVVDDSQQPLAIRRAAVGGLDRNNENDRARLLDLATSDAHPLQVVALQTLRGALLTAGERSNLSKAGERSTANAQLFERLTVLDWRPANRPAPTDAAGWSKWLAGARGNSQRGERLFFQPSGAGCAVCHRIRGRGGLIGPDLSEIRGMTADRLLESIRLPNAEIAPQFAPWRIEMNDGRVFTGLLLTEKGDDQVFANENGELRTIKRDEIALRNPIDRSIMPAGLADRMTDQELRDLIAFLLSQP